MRVPRRLGVLLAALGWLYVRKIHRYRDPVRMSAKQTGELLSPADGQVCFVRQVERDHTSGVMWPVSDLFGQGSAREGWLIGIYVSALDTHYTYYPTSGTLLDVQTTSGKSGLRLRELAALTARQPVDLLTLPAITTSERVVYTLKDDGQGESQLQVAALAGAASLQATIYATPDKYVGAGHKAMFLPEGGLVVTYLPSDFVPDVGVGEQVRGAETILARKR